MAVVGASATITAATAADHAGPLIGEVRSGGGEGGNDHLHSATPMPNRWLGIQWLKPRELVPIVDQNGWLPIVELRRGKHAAHSDGSDKEFIELHWTNEQRSVAISHFFYADQHWRTLASPVEAEDSAAVATRAGPPDQYCWRIQISTPLLSEQWKHYSDRSFCWLDYVGSERSIRVRAIDDDIFRNEWMPCAAFCGCSANQHMSSCTFVRDTVAHTLCMKRICEGVTSRTEGGGGISDDAFGQVMVIHRPAFLTNLFAHLGLMQEHFQAGLESFVGRDGTMRRVLLIQSAPPWSEMRFIIPLKTDGSPKAAGTPTTMNAADLASCASMASIHHRTKMTGTHRFLSQPFAWILGPTTSVSHRPVNNLPALLSSPSTQREQRVRDQIEHWKRMAQNKNREETTADGSGANTNGLSKHAKATRSSPTTAAAAATAAAATTVADGTTGTTPTSKPRVHVTRARPTALAFHPSWADFVTTTSSSPSSSAIRPSTPSSPATTDDATVTAYQSWRPVCLEWLHPDTWERHDFNVEQDIVTMLSSASPQQLQQLLLTEGIPPAALAHKVTPLGQSLSFGGRAAMISQLVKRYQVRFASWAKKQSVTQTRIHLENSFCSQFGPNLPLHPISFAEFQLITHDLLSTDSAPSRMVMCDYPQSLKSGYSTLLQQYPNTSQNLRVIKRLWEWRGIGIMPLRMSSEKNIVLVQRLLCLQRETPPTDATATKSLPESESVDVERFKAQSTDCVWIETLEHLALPSDELFYLYPRILAESFRPATPPLPPPRPSASLAGSAAATTSITAHERSAQSSSSTEYLPPPLKKAAHPRPRKPRSATQRVTTNS